MCISLQTCWACGEQAPIALRKCRTCGDEFPKKEKDWASIRKLKKPNPTVQRDLLERRVINLIQKIVEL